MIYKISPDPSLPKRGREEGIFLKRGNRGKILTEGEHRVVKITHSITRRPSIILVQTVRFSYGFFGAYLVIGAWNLEFIS